MLGAMSSDEKGGSQRAIKRPRVSPGPLADLKALLYQLYLEAGTPRLKQIAEWAAMAGMPGPDTVARIVGSATMCSRFTQDEHGGDALDEHAETGISGARSAADAHGGGVLLTVSRRVARTALWWSW
jgi:hypothetical protein